MENEFEAIWSRIKAETDIKTMGQLAEIVGITQPAISKAKAKNSFSASWAYEISHKYGLLTEWIMTGEGPKRLDEAAAPESPATRTLPPYLWALAEWATEMSGAGGHDWLQKQLDICLPTFKMWREQKVEAAALHSNQIINDKEAV